MIGVSLQKAKIIAHEIRRERREQELTPFDKIVSLQLGAANVAAAEASRVAIRAKYETIQNEIDSAVTADQLKAIISAMKETA